MKKRIKNVVVGCLVGAVLVGGTATLGVATKGFVNWNVNEWKNNFVLPPKEDVPVDPVILKENIIENGISVKVQSLATGDFSGLKEITYSTNVSGTINVSKTGGGGLVSFTHDPALKKIVVSCSGPFSEQAIITIFAVDDPSINSIVKVDYEQKLERLLVNNAANTQNNYKNILVTGSAIFQNLNELFAPTLTRGTITSNVTYEFVSGIKTDLDQLSGPYSPLRNLEPLSATFTNSLQNIVHTDLATFSNFSFTEMRSAMVEVYNINKLYQASDYTALRYSFCNEINVKLNDVVVDTYRLWFPTGFVASTQNITTDIGSIVF